MNPLSPPALVARCPDRDTLADFLTDRLPDPVRREVGTHLAACPACDDRLLALAGEADAGLGERVGAAWRLGVTPTFGEPAYRAMEAAAKALSLGLTIGGNKDFALAGLAPALPPDLRVGPYRVRAAVGSGGMGVVYEARHEVLNRAVALKMIRAGVYAASETIARFHTEGEAVARFDHPNIARLYEFGTHQDLPYFAMEWVGGGTLAARLEAGPLGFRDAAEVVRTLAGAMAYAHARKVIHRDLKPANVLLGADGTPKVADFGLAKLIDAEGPGLTASEAVFGTPSYMSPEQAEGRAGDIGPLSDVYSLGAILYETLTGRPPFLAATKSATLKLAVKGDLVAPSKLRPQVPRDLEAICLKCLEPKPARRYTSALALAEDLGRWLAEKPTVARPRTRLGRAARALGRRSVAVATCVILAGCAIGAAVLYAPTREDPPDKASSAGRRAALAAALARGGPVALIDESGTPAYVRVRHGDERTTTASKDGVFTVSSWSTYLLELVPDPGHDSFRFTVQVRHEASDLTGEVGIYFLHEAFPGPGVQENQLYARMTYNDVRQARDLLPLPQLRPGVPPPVRKAESRARMGLDTAGEIAPGKAWEARTELAAKASFLPRGAVGDTWRELTIEVGPAGVDGTWDGQAAGRVRADDVGANFARWLREVNTQHPNPVWANAPATYRPRGGVGLMLKRGTASFRAAVITPLPK